VNPPRGELSSQRSKPTRTRLSRDQGGILRCGRQGDRRRGTNSERGRSVARDERGLFSSICAALGASRLLVYDRRRRDGSAFAVEFEGRRTSRSGSTSRSGRGRSGGPTPTSTPTSRQSVVHREPHPAHAASRRARSRPTSSLRTRGDGVGDIHDLGKRTWTFIRDSSTGTTCPRRSGSARGVGSSPSARSAWSAL
jgi:hypothetical protein